tara:strand:- start:674 stop:1432 length:759 start_codon:yes stop_codon:yes gene_type:complete
MLAAGQERFGMSFRGKVAVVTGAAGGVGSVIVESLRAEGAVVLAADLIAPEGDQNHSLVVDVTQSASCESLIDTVMDRFGRLDILVNNAGVIHVGEAVDTSDTQWRHVLSVNLDGAFYMSRAAIPHLIETRGVIVNIGSDFSFVGGDSLVAYCASKGGMLQMTKAMALDHAAQGVRINIVCPTVIDTPMVDELARQLGNTPGDQRRIYDATVPDGRMISPDEVSDAVLYLAGDRARHVTGTSLVIDGGVTAR